MGTPAGLWSSVRPVVCLKCAGLYTYFLVLIRWQPGRGRGQKLQFEYWKHLQIAALMLY